LSATLRRDDIQRHIVGSSAPAAVEAEKALLGVVLANTDAMDMVEGLKSEHFYEPIHGRLWGAISDRHAHGSTSDATIIDGLFTSDEAYHRAGGFNWLCSLSELSPSASKAAGYADLIREAAARRALITLTKDIGDKAQDQESGAVSDLVAELEHNASEIARISDLAEEWQNPGDMISGAVERARARKGVIEFPIGIPEVDRLLGGMHRQEVTVLAARPGMGKSVGAQAYAKAIARNGMAVAFFSLEMGPDPMALRLACDLAYDRERPTYLGTTSNITLERIGRNELAPEEWDRLAAAEREGARLPLRYDTRPGHTMARIEALSRRLFRKAEQRGVPRGAIVIDHMGKVRPTKNRQGNLRMETIDVSRDASEMAKRLDVPVLLLCQLNRGLEGRLDKQPNLSDLREAGQIEEDARQVIFLHRPEYFLRAPPEGEETFDAKVEREAKLDAARNKLFWIVAKNSHGPMGTALTFCDVAASAVREWR
jgi:replicative DNA helicase